MIDMSQRKKTVRIWRSRLLHLLEVDRVFLFWLGIHFDSTNILLFTNFDYLKLRYRQESGKFVIEKLLKTVL